MMTIIDHSRITFDDDPAIDDDSRLTIHTSALLNPEGIEHEVCWACSSAKG